jgi:hypothetical protein
MTSLPFKIRGVYTGFVDLEGIARLEEKELCLEYRMSHVISRYIKSKPKEIRIAVEELEEATFKHVVCIGLLRLRARRLGAFSQVPGSEGGELRLRCRREHWPLAQELASRLSMRTVEHQLRALVAETSRTLEVPTQAPVIPEAGPAKRDARIKLSGE